MIKEVEEIIKKDIEIFLQMLNIPHSKYEKMVIKAQLDYATDLLEEIKQQSGATGNTIGS